MEGPWYPGSVGEKAWPPDDRKNESRSGAGPSDGALVVAARAGERWAQEALFRRYGRMVNGMAFRILGRASDVDDLAQESFVQALTNLDKLENPNAFRSWLGGIVVRQAGKMLRRRKLRQRFGLERSEPLDVETMIGRTAPPDAASELRAVYQVLEQLPVESRVALVLRRVEGMKLEEVAERMNLSLATVKRRLKVAEKHLEAAKEELR